MDVEFADDDAAPDVAVPPAPLLLAELLAFDPLGSLELLELLLFDALPEFEVL